jgi:phosphoenolpyruvate synthase/pyruvate phosphate dikinase
MELTQENTPIGTKLLFPSGDGVIHVVTDNAPDLIKCGKFIAVNRDGTWRVGGHKRNTECLVRVATPEDIAGMNAALGTLTSKGGATSHAAVVARGLDKVCVVGCTALHKVGGTWVAKDGNVEVALPEGSWITIEGATGKVWLGKVPMIDGSASKEVQDFRKLVQILVVRSEQRSMTLREARVLVSLWPGWA